ncbi:MAG: T9SS type A sorting domain-containing protein, partial [Bacteroidetes bacterium]|nr:T9SS type A sorting domain-containing protein [Bacteroidota bacterium]
EMYDAARSGASTPLNDYPTGSPSSFWSSGRLPYMLTVDATIDGIAERIQLINIHAKSGSNSGDLTRRRYDVQALKDSLDQYHADANIILLGDYNDDVDVSIGGGASTYSLFVDDTDFDVITASLSEAGLRSFITRDNVIAHITVSNELTDNYLEGTETLVIPFNYIYNYVNTTSDHLAVLTRFELYEPLALNIAGGKLVYNGYAPEACTTLTSSVSGGKEAYTYEWSDGSTEPSLDVCPDSSTEYTLTVTDAAGNQLSESFSVCVIDAGCAKDKLQLCWQPNPNKAQYVQLCVPEALAGFFIDRGASIGACFAAEACESAEKEATSARTAQQQQPDVQYLSLNSAIALTPSLVSSRAKVDFVVLEEGRTTVKVYSTAGQAIATLYNGVDAFGTLQTAEFSVDSFGAGIYLVKMTTASGSVFTSKFVVQH